MFPPPPARSQYSVLIRVRGRVRCRVRCRVRSRLRVAVGIRVKFKCSVGVLHRLGGEGCYVGKGNEINFFGWWLLTLGN